MSFESAYGEAEDSAVLLTAVEELGLLEKGIEELLLWED
jgi:hypothetical protein